MHNNAINKTLEMTNIVSAILIKIGDNTHNHGQSITLHNFNTINTIVNALVKLIPVEVEL